MKMRMDSKYLFSAGLVLAIALVACSFKQKDRPVDPAVLPGRYCHSTDGRDSIFIYPDNTYKHSYHRSDGTLLSQTNTWRYKSDISHIFFESFLSYNDGEHVETADYNGSWPTKVFLTEEGQVKLRYSESVYYVKSEKK